MPRLRSRNSVSTAGKRVKREARQNDAMRLSDDIEKGLKMAAGLVEFVLRGVELNPIQATILRMWLEELQEVVGAASKRVEPLPLDPDPPYQLVPPVSDNTWKQVWYDSQTGRHPGGDMVGVPWRPSPGSSWESRPFPVGGEQGFGHPTTPASISIGDDGAHDNG